ncbi:hypothetical protein [Niallia sp. JL1B1071]|uniref:hypothetical protein n=1 Tax=Niallia tiangongensis TaxID=3237105 RepID=UPI0037DD1699
MDNFTNDNTARRFRAHVSVLGTTQIHLRNPYIIGWWIAAFPGFGHHLLSKNLRRVCFIYLSSGNKCKSSFKFSHDLFFSSRDRQG